MMPPPAAWYSADAPSVVVLTSCAPSKSVKSHDPPDRTLLIETPSVRIVVSLLLEPMTVTLKTRL